MAANDEDVFCTDQFENKIRTVTFHSTDILASGPKSFRQEA